jgi:DNA polymerase elongation subunit (family B)
MYKKDKALDGLNVLVFDIETVPALAATYHTGKQTLCEDQLISDPYIASIQYKWYGDSNVKVLLADLNKSDDKAILKTFVEIVDKADWVVYHNGDSFDWRWVQQRLAYHKLPALAPKESTDTMRACKKHFKLMKYTLSYCCKYFKVSHKKESGGFKTWVGLLLKDKKVLKDFKAYGKQDVISLEQLFIRILPYITKKPKVKQTLSDFRCECGSKSYVKNGTRLTTAGVRQQQIRCKGCASVHYVTPKGLVK